MYYFTINPIAISQNKKRIEKERKIGTRFNDESYGWEKRSSEEGRQQGKWKQIKNRSKCNRTWMEI